MKNLPDRAELMELANQYITSGKQENKSVAVLIIRITKLREINEEYGFDGGDQILAEIVKRIMSIMRKGDNFGRVIGSDFGLVLHSLHGVGQAILAAQKIIKLSKKSIRVNRSKLVVKLAVGIAMFPEHGDEAINLFRYAEQAASHAVDFVDGYELFSGDDDSTTHFTVTMENELEKAISTGAIQFHYQPIINLLNNKLVGMEALARWNSPTQGPISPDFFITSAEKSGLILPLTLLTLNTCLNQCAEIQTLAPKSSMSINMSAKILHEEELPELIMRAVDLWNIQPEYLTLEVTESAVMTDPGKSLQTLNNLSSQKIKIAVDDFGTGQSSLRYLKLLPLNKLKIDKSFVMNMTSNEDDIKITKTIIDLSHNFGLSVIAEGIENVKTMKLLKDQGCEFGQGYFIGKPMPFPTFIEWIKATQGK